MKKGKGPFKKNKENITKVKCFNYSNKGYFTRDCIEPKKVKGLLTLMTVINISISIIMTKSNPLWTVNSDATDYVAKDRNAFIEFQRLSQGAR